MQRSEWLGGENDKLYRRSLDDEEFKVALGKRERTFNGSLCWRNRSRRGEASDRFNINSQLEHLQARYVGTGHADLTRFEWAVNIQRDSFASYVGHYPMLAYFAIAENESIGRERYNFMQKMLAPCGLPPEREDD
nr:Splicing factor 3B subunit, putative [Ipomoea batatas]